MLLLALVLASPASIESFSLPPPNPKANPRLRAGVADPCQPLWLWKRTVSSHRFVEVDDDAETSAEPPASLAIGASSGRALRRAEAALRADI